jgi:hypothetical protein
MGEAFIVRRGGVAEEVDTTATPTITEVSVTDSSITFTVTNNDTDEAIVYYDLDPVVDFSVDSVTLDDGDTSSNITISDLDDDEEYIVYAIASAFGKQFSPQASLAITTDEIPTFELLYDSLTADDGDPITLPATQLDITGLSIGKNDELRMVYTFVGDDASNTADYALFPNDLTTAGNYTRQGLEGSGTTISAGRASNADFANARSSSGLRRAGFADIKVSENSRFVVQSQFTRIVGSTDILNSNVNIVGSETVTSITKLSIVSSRTDGIASGSRIRLYKVNTGEA